MEEQNVQATPNARPGFLTVLCILTFIGSGLGVLFSLLGIFGLGALNNFVAQYGGTSADAGILKPILILVFSAASLYGAIQMWNLKRLGFYIYSSIWLEYNGIGICRSFCCFVRVKFKTPKIILLFPKNRPNSRTVFFLYCIAPFAYRSYRKGCNYINIVINKTC